MSGREKSGERSFANGEKRFVRLRGIEMDEAFLESEHISHDAIKKFVESFLERIDIKTPDRKERLLLILDVLNPLNLISNFSNQIEEMISNMEGYSEEGKNFFRNAVLALYRKEIGWDSSLLAEYGVDTETEEKINGDHSSAAGDFESLIESAKTNELSSLEFMALIEANVNSIRRAIIEELANHLEPDQYALLKKEIAGPSKGRPFAARIITAHNPKTSRDYALRSTLYDAKMEKRLFSERQKSFRLGCEKLMAAGRHPNVLPILGFDSQKLEIQVPERKLVTLLEIYNNLSKLKSGEEKRKATLDLVRLLCDGASGAEFLAEKGLVLEDLKLDNIAKDLDRDIGVLFDLDYIARIGEERIINPVYTFSYEVPEWGTLLENSVIPTEKEMVYQLGVVLEKIGESRHTIFSNEESVKIAALMNKMIEENPKKRITVKEAVQELKSIISSFPENSKV